MSSTIAPDIQLPEGYAVSERIGSGGYGEVWRATAPGGVEKAVKVVYGHCSEDLAERELKSLERIRSVRHPFVISLERFEIVGGRLIIVTELADMSLDACFRKYHEAGETGIPRDELLAYLRDAADALDCLVERHSLQHLDIKPENLLVVGDHVKVGDFGLVKELATRTLNSMMGGMTPLYSAPEVFDDDPSPRSDQYSLAIVYQQMLTGQLPFPGRTPAQLAKQHTQAEPNLQSLSESDRKVMRRALAKKPEQRFASCREFIATLTSGGVRPAPQAAAPATATSRSSVSTPAEDDTKSIAAIQTQPVGRPPASAAAPAATNPRVRCEQSEPAKAPAVALAYPEVNDQIFDVPPPTFHSAGAQTTATLFVAAGGLGLTLLRATRRRIGRTDPGELSRGNLAWIAIDTDRETLNEATGEETACRLPGTDTLHIPLKRPKQYRDGSQALLRWVSRRWLYNIPRSLETRGYRPLGRIAAVDHAESILGSLYTRLHQLAHSNSSAAPLRVVLLAGTSGGTGSGVVVDLAQAVRSLATDLGVEVQVHAVLAMPERVAGSTESLSIANTYSLLTELTHVEREGNRGTSSPTGPAERYEADGPAFDAVYLVPIPPRTFGDGRVQTFVSIAEYLALEATTAEVAGALGAYRQADRTDDFRLRSFGCAAVPDGAREDALPAPVELDILGLGHRRLTLWVSPNASEVPAVWKKLRPTTANCLAPVSSQVLISEASGLDPLDIAARLAEFYPDIAQAADRLHTRDDIVWRDLREAAPPSPPGRPAPFTPPAAARPEESPVASAATDPRTIKRSVKA